MDGTEKNIIAEHDEKYHIGKIINVRREELYNEFDNRLKKLCSALAEISDIFMLHGESGCGKTMFLSDLYSECASRDDCYVVRYDFEAGSSSIEFLKSISDALMWEHPGSFVFPLFDRACWQMEKNKRETDKRYSFRYTSFLEAHPELAAVMDYAAGIVPKLKMAGGILKGLDKGLSAVEVLKRFDWTKYEREKRRMVGISEKMLVKEIPGYFIEDLAKCNKVNKKPVVILLDSFECTKGKDISWLTDPYNGLICSIPGILWVIAGQEEMQGGVFNYASVKGRSMRINEFTEAEAKAFLDNAGIDKKLRDSSVKAAGTSPYMLNFTVSMYKEILEERMISKKEDVPLMILGKKLQLPYSQGNNSVESQKKMEEISDFKKVFSLYFNRLDREERRVFFAFAFIGKWNGRIAEAVLEAINTDGRDKGIVEIYEKAYNNLISRQYVHWIDNNGETANEWEDCEKDTIMQFERSLADHVSGSITDLTDIDEKFRAEVIKTAVKTAVNICDDCPVRNQERAVMASELLMHYLRLNKENEGEFIENLEYAEKILERNSEFSLACMEIDDVFRSLYEFAKEQYGEESPAAAVAALYIVIYYLYDSKLSMKKDETEDIGAGENIQIWELAEYSHGILIRKKEKYGKELMLSKICRMYFREELKLNEEEIYEDIKLICDEAESIITSGISKSDTLMVVFKDYLLSRENETDDRYKKCIYEIAHSAFEYRKSIGVASGLMEYKEQLRFAQSAFDASGGDKSSDYYKTAIKIRDSIGEYLMDTDPADLSQHDWWVYVFFSPDVEILYDKTSDKEDPAYRKIKLKLNEDWIFNYETLNDNETGKWDTAYTEDERKRSFHTIVGHCQDIISYCRKAGEYADSPEKYKDKALDAIEKAYSLLYPENGFLKYPFMDPDDLKKLGRMMKDYLPPEDPRINRIKMDEEGLRNQEKQEQ